MKLVRYQQGSDVHHGILEGETIHRIEGDFFGVRKATGENDLLGDVRLLAPVVPGKAIIVGLNYHDHAREMNLKLPEEPLILLKATSSLADPLSDIVCPPQSAEVHYEAELAIVVGKTAKNVKAEAAAEYILGYTCANDVTARDLQRKDSQWVRSKSFDTFMPLGPCVETAIDPANIPVKLKLNGEVKQSSNTSNLIFEVYELIAYISSMMTLCPGDVILTGTPAGVGPMKPGDTVTVELGGIGELTNKVV